MAEMPLLRLAGEAGGDPAGDQDGAEAAEVGVGLPEGAVPLCLRLPQRRQGVKHMRRRLGTAALQHPLRELAATGTGKRSRSTECLSGKTTCR